MNKVTCSLLIVLFLLSGCNMVGQGDVKPLYIGGHSKLVDQSEADEAKQIVLSMDEVVAVRGATLEDDIFIAMKVKQFDRLFLDRIRKDAAEKVKKRFPNAKAHISTDKKVFLELEKLEQELYQNKINKSDLEKRWTKIEEHMKG